ncbi:MAG: hypothetical protein AB1815_06295 [Bacillota bacterium]
MSEPEKSAGNARTPTGKQPSKKDGKLRTAVKRSIKAGASEKGFKSIEQWRQNWDAKGITVNHEVVLVG